MMTEDELNELLDMIRSEAARMKKREEIERKRRLQNDLIQIGKARDARLLRQEIHNRGHKRRVK